MKTFRTLGTDYPVIKTLGRGWHLVAHQNGPAIAKVWDDDAEGGLLASPARPHEDLPEDIRTAAVEALMDATWPNLKPAYYKTTETNSTTKPPIMDDDDTRRDLAKLCQDQTKLILELSQRNKALAAALRNCLAPLQDAQNQLHHARAAAAYLDAKLILRES